MAGTYERWKLEMIANQDELARVPHLVRVLPALGAGAEEVRDAHGALERGDVLAALRADELGELDGHGRAHARGGAGVRAADGLQVGVGSGMRRDWIWLCSVSYASVRIVHAYGYDIVLRIHIASLRSLMVAIKTRDTRFGTSGTVSGRA